MVFSEDGRRTGCLHNYIYTQSSLMDLSLRDVTLTNVFNCTEISLPQVLIYYLSTMLIAH